MGLHGAAERGQLTPIAPLENTNDDPKQIETVEVWLQLSVNEHGTMVVYEKSEDKNYCHSLRRKRFDVSVRVWLDSVNEKSVAQLCVVVRQ